MSKELPTNATGLNAYIESLMSKHIVTPVPTDDELRAYVSEYQSIRATKQDDITTKQANEKIKRLGEIERHIKCYREYHYGAKH